MKEIAILVYIWGKHMPILRHYLAHLPDAHQRTVIFMQCIESATITQLKTLGAKTLTLEEEVYAFSEMEKYEVQRYNIKARAHISQAFNTPSWHAFCSTIGAPEPSTSAAITQQLNDNASKITFYLQWLEKLKESYFIELIVTSEDVTHIARSAILWGKKANIPSLHLQHSPGTGRQPPVHSQHLADHMTVYGERAATAFATQPNEPLHITGNPNWDVYTRHAHQKAAVRQTINAKYTLTAEHALIVFGTTWASQLSAHIDMRIHQKTLNTVFQAIRILKTRGRAMTLVIKDRASNAEAADNTAVTDKLAHQHGFTAADFRHTVNDLAQLILAADVLISSDSSLSIEAMHALTPAINLDTEWPMILGPSFHAEDGVLSVIDYNATQLAEHLEALLYNRATREKQVNKMRRHRALYNASAEEGHALDNIVALMNRVKRPLPQ